MLNMLIMMLFVVFNTNKITAPTPAEPEVRDSSFTPGAKYLESGFIDGGMNRLMN